MCRTGNVRILISCLPVTGIHSRRWSFARTMPIKVAYDISNLAADFGRYDAVHGINRVVNEVLNELCDRDDLEITATALDGDDPVVDSVKASLYLEHKQPPVKCGVDYSFFASAGLTTVYKTVYRETQS